MNDIEFIQHCKGLNDKLDKNDIAGFYFFVNKARDKNEKIGSISACGIYALPRTFQNIFILLHCLNNKEVSRDTKKNIAKVLGMAVTAAAIDLEDIIQPKKGEGNG